MSIKEELLLDKIAEGERDYISFSEIKTWCECSFKHKLGYVESLRKFEVNVFNGFGEAIHSTCEHYILTRELDINKALEIIKARWEEFSLPDVDQWLQKASNVLRYVPEFLNNKFPGWEGISSEEQLYETIDYPGCENIEKKFHGYVDAVLKCGDKYWILDWKSAGINGWKDWKRNDENTRMQLYFYKYFWLKKHPEVDPSKLNCGFVLMSREADQGAKTPIELFAFDINETNIRHSFSTLENMVYSVKKRRHLKVHKEAKFAPCKFCEFDKTEYCP